MNNKIPATESNPGPPVSGKPAPVVCVYSKGDREAEQSTLELFRTLGWQGWSLSREEGVGEEGGSTTGDNGYADSTFTGPEQLGQLLIEHDRRYPGHPLLLVDAGLAVTASAVDTLSGLLHELAPADEDAVVLTVLSNANPGLNPFAGLTTPHSTESAASEWESIVALLGQGRIYEHHHWPAHLLFFSVEAIQILAQADIRLANALSRLRLQDGRLLLVDNCFVHDPHRGLVDQPPLEPHEQRRPPAWGNLVQRLDGWLRSKPANVGEYLAGGKPLTLHVTHSWGGGVAQWVHSFIAADEKGLNFQLRSEGPQSEEGAGQRLSLYFGNKTDAPIASWWLQPPIRSTIESSKQYRSILREISRRYGVGRIIVSSLVGHSLDALGTGLPTVQVLHDFYPCWPLLGIHPGNYQTLEQALSENTLLPDFRDRDPQAWKSLGDSWRQTVRAHCGR